MSNQNKSHITIAHLKDYKPAEKQKGITYKKLSQEQLEEIVYNTMPTDSGLRVVDGKEVYLSSIIRLERTENGEVRKIIGCALGDINLAEKQYANDTASRNDILMDLLITAHYSYPSQYCQH